MRANQLTGIKPFNKFNFRSCYYHQLMAGLSCLGLSGDNILLSDFIFVGEDFTFDSTFFSSERVRQKLAGYKSKKTKLTKKLLIKSIDHGRPVIAGIDCFYWESRKDTYRRIHDPHFILVYGYDLDKETLEIVDHDYRNSFQYEEKQVPLAKFLLANEKFCTDVLCRKTNCHVLRRNKWFKDRCGVLSHIEERKLYTNCVNSQRNLERIKCLIANDITLLAEKADDIVKYLNAIKLFLLRVRYTEMVEQEKDAKLAIDELINGYTYLLALFWKITRQNNFDYAINRQGDIFRKIDSIIDTEQKFYGFIARFAK